MATAAKVLAVNKPGAASDQTLYTVPGSTQAEVTIYVANQSASSDKIRIYVGVLAAANAIAYDLSVGGNLTVQFTGICLAAGEIISIYSTNGTSSFVATGLEIT